MHSCNRPLRIATNVRMVVQLESRWKLFRFGFLATIAATSPILCFTTKRFENLKIKICTKTCIIFNSEVIDSLPERKSDCAFAYTCFTYAVKVFYLISEWYNGGCDISICRERIHYFPSVQ